PAALPGRDRPVPRPLVVRRRATVMGTAGTARARPRGRATRRPRPRRAARTAASGGDDARRPRHERRRDLRRARPDPAEPAGAPARWRGRWAAGARGLLPWLSSTAGRP